MKKLIERLMESRSEVGTMMPSATSWLTTCSEELRDDNKLWQCVRTRQH